MPSFIWLPEYSGPKDVEPRVLVARFGDGYEQRVGDGINTQLRSWSLAFEHRDQTEADAIEAFLSAQGGVESFDWTDPHGHAGKWVCPKWSRTPIAGTLSTINVVFREVPA